MLRKLTASMAVVALAASLVAADTGTAQAGHGGRVAAGVAAGIITLGVLGAYAHARDRGYSYRYRAYGECYPGRERCGYVGRRCGYNDWGDYVCWGGHYRCWRPTVCD